MGVRSPAGLHVRDIFGRGDVGDIEDANAAEPVVADSLFDSLVAAVKPAAEALAGYEQQVVVDGNVALGGRAPVGDDRCRIHRIGDVPDLDPVVVALNCVVAGERQIGVRLPHKRILRGRGRHQAEVPDRLSGVEEAGSEADSGVGRGRVDVQAGGTGEGGRRRRRGHIGGHAGTAAGLRGAAVQRGQHGNEGEGRACARAVTKGASRDCGQCHFPVLDMMVQRTPKDQLTGRYFGIH